MPRLEASGEDRKRYRITLALASDRGPAMNGLQQQAAIN